jgi:hypothetical protein
MKNPDRFMKGAEVFCFPSAKATLRLFWRMLAIDRCGHSIPAKIGQNPPINALGALAGTDERCPRKSRYTT